MWWGISLLLWGIGAIFAGTSYQAFGYEIKCAGRSECAWTSWWEVVYLMLQHVSMSALLVAVAYSSTAGVVQNIVILYAIANSVVYVICALIGGIVPIKACITFSLMVQVSTPILLILIIINGWQFYMLGTCMELVLLITWFLLLLTSGVYWLYDYLGITETLWSGDNKIWFSQNDVLHVCLIFWMIYIVTVVANQVSDYSILDLHF